MSSSLETSRAPGASVRSGAGSSDVTLADLTWDALPSDAHEITPKTNGLVFHFTGSAALVECTDVEIWGYAPGATAQLQWIGGVTIGTLQNDDSTYMADTITTTTDETATGAKIRDGGGDNRHATLQIDAADLKHWVVRFPSLASGTMNCFVTSY